MKKALFLILITFFQVSCEKDYRNEVFTENFRYVYGEWQHIRTSGGWSGGLLSEEDYKIAFYPNAKFSYNGGKEGIITVEDNTGDHLLVDFNSLFPRAGLCYVNTRGTDTLIIGDNGFDMSVRYYRRINTVNIPDGTYSGTFQRITSEINGEISNVSLTFSGRNWTGQSDKIHYPALCRGSYTPVFKKLAFSNGCYWTANFDGTLILCGDYDYSISGKHLEIYRTIKGNSHFTTDRYILDLHK